jgi:RNA polymerase sigma-70 factor (ECF subfamily)
LPAQPDYNEPDILQLVSRGDEIAFTQLFLHWRQLLAGYIFRITESRELTEEIVQDVFLNIWMVRETLTEINHFKHFLIVVARNKTFDALKKQLRAEQKRKAWEKENANALYQPDADPDGSHSSVIEQAIDHLPPRRKEIYLLSRHERLTYKEIASRLNISTESVKTHLKLATGSITAFIRAHLGELSLLAIIFSKKI